MIVSSENELCSIFAETLAEIVSAISGFSLNIVSSGGDDDFYEMVGLMNLKGKKHGTVFISAGEDDMRTLCSFMIGVPKNEITGEEANDALCELVNMTAGNVKLRLNSGDYMFVLSAPFLIKGRNMSIIAERKLHVTSRVLTNGDISLKLKIVY